MNMPAKALPLLAFAFGFAVLAVAQGCSLVGGASPPLAIPTAVAQPAGDHLDPGPLEAVLVYLAPTKPSVAKADPPRPAAPKAEIPKPDPPKPDPPKVPSGPSAALVAAQRELAALRADSAAIQAAQAELQTAQAELRSAGGSVAAQLQSAEAQLQATALAREMEVQQVRNNQCCSVCGNSKTELEKGGKRFMDHLLEVKGTVARCAPSKLAQVENKYEARLASQRAAVQQLKNQVGPQRAAAQAKVDAAQAKVEAAKRDQAAKIKAAEDKVAALSK